MKQSNQNLIKNLIQELNERKLTINNINNSIKEKTEIYKKEVRDAKKLIESEQRKIKKLQETEISFTAESLIEEIAKEWNVNVEDLNINLNTYLTKKKGKFKKEEFLEMYENNFSNSENLQLEITVKFMEKNFYTCLPINLQDEQKDGRKLRECVDVYVERVLFIGYLTDFDFIDYKNLTFKLKYKNIIVIKHRKKDKLKKEVNFKLPLFT